MTKIRIIQILVCLYHTLSWSVIALRYLDRSKSFIVVLVIGLGISDPFLGLKLSALALHSILKSTQRTFRVGLLNAKLLLPSPSCLIPILAGVSGESNPLCTSDFGTLFSSCELGGSGASLLATGVILCDNVFFRNVFGVGLGLMSPLLLFAGLLFNDGTATVPLADALEKNPRIEDCPLDWTLEFGFRRVTGRAGVLVSDLLVFAMILSLEFLKIWLQLGGSVYVNDQRLVL
jgi:hypothetical protein